ncbi:MAG: hypothetical protein H0T79_15460 [Deltaproteobacteria bacterium]|nr:hypothetical protein [Deltaproteobacteria bacterium]
MMLELPSGAAMPLPYRWVYAHGIRELPPWSMIDDQAQAIALRDEFLLEVQTPNPATIRDWFPFASHRSQDDRAGFVLVDGVPSGEVAVVHLTWRARAEQPGWPSMVRYPTFWAWLRDCMLDDAAEWAELNGEDDLADLADA